MDPLKRAASYAARNWLPLFDAFLNPSEDFRVEVLTVGTLFQGSGLVLVA